MAPHILSARHQTALTSRAHASTHTPSLLGRRSQAPRAKRKGNARRPLPGPPDSQTLPEPTPPTIRCNGKSGKPIAAAWCATS